MLNKGPFKKKSFHPCEINTKETQRQRFQMCVLTYLQLRQTAEQVKYSSGKNEYKVICLSDSSPQKRSLRPWESERTNTSFQGTISWKTNFSQAKVVHHLLAELDTRSQAGEGSVCVCSLLAASLRPAAPRNQWEVWRSGSRRTAQSWRPPSSDSDRENASAAVCRRCRPHSDLRKRKTIVYHLDTGR